MAHIVVFISTSSTELRFLRAQLRECRHFASNVVVSCGSHRYDGITPEPVHEVAAIVKEFPEATLVQYMVKKPGAFENPLKRRPEAFWHNISRIACVQKYHEVTTSDANDGNTWVVFLDGDEIPDGKAVKEWKGTILPKIKQHIALKLSNYWYFREPTYRATKWEDSIVMVPCEVLTKDKVMPLLMHDCERNAFLEVLPLAPHVLGVDGKPMFHHFSWVRSKEQLLQKVKVWGHRNDEPWEQWIEEEWGSSNFSGTDFVHQYTYEVVHNQFGV